MEASLSFTLPEQNAEFLLAVKAPEYYNVLCALEQYLRSQLKYNNDLLSPEAEEALQQSYNKLQQLMQEHNISLDGY